ncbi:methyltransferase family protein [Winogradskyella vidalii]|uniref:methyltransferase family protein n=1 Tax=Winogradskyella vidalii TaxID=2615024 RepID=UPI0015C821D4|nr:isoprenylcysteine carboxylmethyltransferase family protein [Winogradskyella vidalii]
MIVEKPTKKDYIFVVIQVLLFVAYVVPIKIIAIDLSEWLRYSGLIMAVMGFIFGGIAVLQINTKLSPFPTPIAGAKLLTNGTYAIARHPIYTSILAITLGYAVYEASVFKLIIFLALGFLFYFKSIYEEQLLLNTFSEYSTYKTKTRRFI